METMMADYGFIARGLQPIDIASPLLQVEQIRQARAQEQRQNELLALRRQEMDDARKKAEAQAAQTETQLRLREEIPSMEAAFAAGRGAEWMATKPELANFADQADNPQFVRMMRNYAYQAAGLEMPASDPGPIEMRDMGGGVHVLMQDGKAVSGGVIRPQEPRFVDQRVIEVRLPDGTVQQQWVGEGQTIGTPIGAPFDPNKKPLSPDKLVAIQDKQLTVSQLRSQIRELRRRFNDMRNSISAGPIQGLLPTEKGRAFDAAVESMYAGIRKLTRTPGEGSMSDYESRLSTAVLPSRNEYESVIEQKIQNLEDLVNVIDTGYSSMISGAQPQPNAGQPAQPSQPASPRTIQLPSGATVTINED